MHILIAIREINISFLGFLYPHVLTIMRVSSV